MKALTVVWIAMIGLGIYFVVGGIMNWGITRGSDMDYRFKADFYILEFLITGGGVGLVFLGGAKLIDSLGKPEAKVRSFWGVN